jgi:hypothetical protein
MRSIDYNNNFKVGDMAADAVLLKFQSRGLDKIDAAYPAVGSLSVYIGEMLNIAQSFDPEIHSQLKEYINARTDAALKEKIEKLTARSGE